jgi:hypothetical protein
MRLIFLAVTVFPFLFSCTHYSVKNTNPPSYMELQGVYYNFDTSWKAKLLLASDADFDENKYAGLFGQYILTVRDSLGEEKVEQGFWDYLPSSSICVECDSIGLFFKPFSSKKMIKGFAHYEYKGYQKRLVIECPVYDLSGHESFTVFNNSKKTFRFEKRVLHIRN